ncbi:MAG: urease accessory protein UreH [Candidatus Binatia bacterium]
MTASWLSTGSVLGVGLLLGIRHALDADHLAAVSAIVSERKSVLSSCWVGALWGLGHTIAVLLAGVAFIGLHVEFGHKVTLLLELCVALMLVGLGVDVLRKLVRGGTLHVHPHRHGRRRHIHPHVHIAAEEGVPHMHHGVRGGARPVLVGMVHGLAGSAALMLLVLATIPSPTAGFAYLAVFGIGSTGGMLCMSTVLGLPFQFTAQRFRRADVVVRTVAGLVSLGLGMLMAYRIGFVEGLFL